MSKTRKTAGIIIGIVVLVAVAVTLWFVYQANKDVPSEGSKTVTIEVLSERDNYSFKESYKTDLEYLGDLLEEKGLIEFTTSQFGRYINAVQGYKALDEDQSWWNILVNGESAITGVDEISLSDGGVYTLQLKIGYDM